MQINQNLRGFTLTELLVVVLIIGILAAVALPQYQKVVDKTRMVQLSALSVNMSQSIQRYHLENGIYPTKWNEIDIDLPGSLGNGGKYYYTKKDDQNYPFAVLNPFGNTAIYFYGGNKYLPGILFMTRYERKEQYCYASNTNQKAQNLCKDICKTKTLGTDGNWKTCILKN